MLSRFSSKHHSIYIEPGMAARVAPRWRPSVDPKKRPIEQKIRFMQPLEFAVGCWVRLRLANFELFRIDSQIDVNLGAIVELADRFRIAFVAVELGVDLVVGGGKAGKAVGAFVPDDIGFYSVRAQVGKVDDRVEDRIVLLIENLAQKKPALGFFFLVGSGKGGKRNDKQQGGGKIRSALQRGASASVQS